ncbi:unnamed protein product, partial [Ectocarpus sp. 8 AP-2014]
LLGLLPLGEDWTTRLGYDGRYFTSRWRGWFYFRRGRWYRFRCWYELLNWCSHHPPRCRGRVPCGWRCPSRWERYISDPSLTSNFGASADTSATHNAPIVKQSCGAFRPLR